MVLAERIISIFLIVALLKFTLATTHPVQPESEISHCWCTCKSDEGRKNEETYYIANKHIQDLIRNSEPIPHSLAIDDSHRGKEDNEEEVGEILLYEGFEDVDEPNNEGNDEYLNTKDDESQKKSETEAEVEIFEGEEFKDKLSKEKDDQNDGESNKKNVYPDHKDDDYHGPREDDKGREEIIYDDSVKSEDSPAERGNEDKEGGSQKPASEKSMDSDKDSKHSNSPDGSAENSETLQVHEDYETPHAGGSQFSSEKETTGEETTDLPSDPESEGKNLNANVKVSDMNSVSLLPEEWYPTLSDDKKHEQQSNGDEDIPGDLDKSKKSESPEDGSPKKDSSEKNSSEKGNSQPDSLKIGLSKEIFFEEDSIEEKPPKDEFSEEDLSKTISTEVKSHKKQSSEIDSSEEKFFKENNLGKDSSEEIYSEEEYSKEHSSEEEYSKEYSSEEKVFESESSEDHSSEGIFSQEKSSEEEYLEESSEEDYFKEDSSEENNLEKYSSEEQFYGGDYSGESFLHEDLREDSKAEDEDISKDTSERDSDEFIESGYKNFNEEEPSEEILGYSPHDRRFPYSSKLPVTKTEPTTSHEKESDEQVTDESTAIDEDHSASSDEDFNGSSSTTERKDEVVFSEEEPDVTSEIISSRESILEEISREETPTKHESKVPIYYSNEDSSPNYDSAFLGERDLISHEGLPYPYDVNLHSDDKYPALDGDDTSEITGYSRKDSTVEDEIEREIIIPTEYLRWPSYKQTFLDDSGIIEPSPDHISNEDDSGFVHSEESYPSPQGKLFYDDLQERPSIKPHPTSSNAEKSDCADDSGEVLIWSGENESGDGVTWPLWKGLDGTIVRGEPVSHTTVGAEILETGGEDVEGPDEESNIPSERKPEDEDIHKIPKHDSSEEHPLGTAEDHSMGGKYVPAWLKNVPHPWRNFYEYLYKNNGYVYNPYDNAPHPDSPTNYYHAPGQFVYDRSGNLVHYPGFRSFVAYPVYTQTYPYDAQGKEGTPETSGSTENISPRHKSSLLAPLLVGYSPPYMCNFYLCPTSCKHRKTYQMH